MTLQLFSFFLLTPILIWAFNTFDNLIKLEYEKFHHQWRTEGKPSGLYWRPAEYRPSFHGGLATQKTMFMLLIRKPAWVESSNYATRLLIKYRILVLVWNIGIVLLVFVKW